MNSAKPAACQPPAALRPTPDRRSRRQRLHGAIIKIREEYRDWRNALPVPEALETPATAELLD